MVVGINGMVHSELIHLVPLLPAVVGAAMLLWARRRRQAAEALGEAGLVQRLAAGDLMRAPNRRIFLVTVAALLLGIAAVGPLWGVEAAPGQGVAADAVLVLDASNSMRVRDVRPDRLEVERRGARELLQRLEGARVAMVIFAGRGYVVAPLTSDFSALELYLDALSPDVVTQGGTSLSDAMEQGLTLLMAGDQRNPSGSLVVMTDGDALEERADIDRAASLAERYGVPVSALGIGTPEGGPVPDIDAASGRMIGYKHEPTGEVAVSRRGDELLAAVAKRTGGTYALSTDAGAADRLAAAVRAAPARPNASRGGTVPGNRYEWFLGAALLLLAADSLLAGRTPQRRGDAEGARA